MPSSPDDTVSLAVGLRDAALGVPVVSLGDRQYTTSLNEYGRDGWELVSFISEAVAVTWMGRYGNSSTT